MSAPSPAQIAALDLLRSHSSWFDPWALSGPRFAGTRASIMGLLAGRPVPKAQAGVTALRAALWAIFDLPADTQAGRQDAFAKAAGTALDRLYLAAE